MPIADSPSNSVTFNPDSPFTNRDLGVEMNKQVDVYINLDNTEKNGMGLPLPPCHVPGLQLRSRSSIPQIHRRGHHRPHAQGRETEPPHRQAPLTRRLERKQTDFDANGKTIHRKSFEITVKNHKTDAVDVIVKDSPSAGPVGKSPHRATIR